MPMRRVVDEDLQRRLEEAIPTKSQKSNTTGETPKSQKKARKPAEKKGGRKKKKQATNLFEQYDQKSDSGMANEIVLISFFYNRCNPCFYGGWSEVDHLKGHLE